MEEHHGSSSAYLQLFMDEATLYNRIVLGSLLPMKLWDPLPHFIQSWVRNCIGGTVIYFLSASLWCFYIYYLNRNLYFPTDAFLLAVSFGCDGLKTLNSKLFC
uniref:Uncharacterized protein n=1 Tax=Quercus lobata TaxID=97700 RepID=A0A7N2KW72_QUELO